MYLPCRPLMQQVYLNNTGTLAVSPIAQKMKKCIEDFRFVLRAKHYVCPGSSEYQAFTFTWDMQFVPESNNDIDVIGSFFFSDKRSANKDKSGIP